jgi:hypothetical protein
VYCPVTTAAAADQNAVFVGLSPSTLACNPPRTQALLEQLPTESLKRIREMYKALKAAAGGSARGGGAAAPAAQPQLQAGQVCLHLSNGNEPVLLKSHNPTTKPGRGVNGGGVRSRWRL